MPHGPGRFKQGSVLKAIRAPIRRDSGSTIGHAGGPAQQAVAKVRSVPVLWQGQDHRKAGSLARSQISGVHPKIVARRSLNAKDTLAKLNHVQI